MDKILGAILPTLSKIFLYSFQDRFRCSWDQDGSGGIIGRLSLGIQRVSPALTHSRSGLGVGSPWLPFEISLQKGWAVLTLEGLGVRWGHYDGELSYLECFCFQTLMNVAMATASSCARMFLDPIPAHATPALPSTRMEGLAKVCDMSRNANTP